MSDQPISASVEIELKNEHGLHARASMKLVAVLKTFNVTGKVEFNNSVANALSLVDIMMLCAKKGHRVRVTCEGIHAHDTCQAIEKLNEEAFGEDPSTR